MKLRSKLIAYTFAVVLLTAFSTLGGALYLHYIETSQEKHLQLKSASIVDGHPYSAKAWAP
jgi:hypothetical protein